MKIYRAASQARNADREVFISNGQKTTRLSAMASQKVWNHSPGGFNWGYGGSGPAQLALAILLDHFADAHTAKNYYQEFKFDVIARLPQGEEWEITSQEIDLWLSDRDQAKRHFKQKFDGHKEEPA